ncbi:TIGR03905 family TSCPD domain-containing protein [Anaeromassilibacillus senegalensis]
MMKYDFTPRGVCSRGIHVELDGNIIRSVRFDGGCSGNTQGVAALAIGMDAEEYIKRCKDIKCGFKSTSCPAQLAIAIQEALAKQG